MAVEPESRSSSSSSVIVVVGIVAVALLGGAIAMMALSRPEATPIVIGGAPSMPSASPPALPSTTNTSTERQSSPSAPRVFEVPPSANVQPGSVPPVSSAASTTTTTKR